MSYEIREPERVAVDSIRGYWYQILHTAEAWLLADDARFIVAEGNEDIDQVLLTTPLTAVEESIKYRGMDVTQGNKAISATILHYLNAFAHHRSKGRNFRGVLRTNAEISADDNTQIGKWILSKRMNVRDFTSELRALVHADEDRCLDAFRSLTSPDEVRAFISSVEWCPRAGSVEEVEDRIRALIRNRAPEAPQDASFNGLVMHLLRCVTNSDPEQRILWRIDADIALNDVILDALERTGAADRDRHWRVALWSRAALPAVAVAVFVDDQAQLEEAVRFARSLDEAYEEARSETEILRELARRVDFVAYVSFRRLKGPKAKRDCMRNVIRQSRHRHTPIDVWLQEDAPAWVDALVSKRWPVPVRVKSTEAAAAILRLASIIGTSVTTTPPDAAGVRALGNKLRWVHRVDDGEYFTSDRPLWLEVSNAE